jgi:hypothetical protein
MDRREYVVQENVPLESGSLLRIADGRGLVVDVRHGTVWITQAGDRADHFVGPGGWFRLTEDGLTIVSALAHSVLTLTSPRPA